MLRKNESLEFLINTGKSYISRHFLVWDILRNQKLGTLPVCMLNINFYRQNGWKWKQKQFFEQYFWIFCMYFPTNVKNWQIWSPMKNQLKSLSFRFVTIIGQNGSVSVKKGHQLFCQNVTFNQFTNNIRIISLKKTPCSSFF